MKILKAISSAWNFITDPKNRKLRNFIILAVLILLIIMQGCRANKWKAEAELQEQEKQRIVNNYEAAQDTIEQYKIDENTWVAEKKGYELTVDELKEDYADLLGDYEFEKNKPPKTVVHTEYVIVEKVDTVPVFAEVHGDTIKIGFSDSAQYSPENFRYLTVNTETLYDISDSTLTLGKTNGSFTLEQGVGIRTYLLKDEETNQVSIVTETDYPNLTFTKIEGANIIDDPRSKEAIRSFRKQFSFGINLGYGLLYSPNQNNVYHGPYLGVGLTWSPKLLQFGK